MADRAKAEELYRTDPNLTFEELVDKYSKRGYSGERLYQKIIDSSQKSRKEINDKLGIGK